MSARKVVRKLALVGILAGSFIVFSAGGASAATSGVINWRAAQPEPAATHNDIDVQSETFATPGVISWLVPSDRDANLFSSPTARRS